MLRGDYITWRNHGTSHNSEPDTRTARADERKSITNESRVCLQAISKISQTVCTRTHQNETNVESLKREVLFFAKILMKEGKKMAVASSHWSPRLFASAADSEI